MKNSKNDNYITLTEMAEGFSEYNIPQTTDFVGKTMKLFKDDGMVIQYVFKDGDKLEYEILEGAHQGLKEEVTYIATSLRPGYYYLSYVDKHNQFISVILDQQKKIATFMLGEFPTDETDKLPIFKRVMRDLPAYASKISYFHASIDAPFTKDTPKHEFTKELVGHLACYSYSEKDAYLHIYHENDMFTWYCFSGNEAGLGDTDYSKFLKLDDNLYVIIWIEKILHVISTIILDFDQKRSSGSMASYEGKDYKGRILNVPSGALIEAMESVDLSGLTPIKLEK